MPESDVPNPMDMIVTVLKNPSPWDIAMVGLGVFGGYCIDRWHFHSAVSIASPLQFGAACAFLCVSIKYALQSIVQPFWEARKKSDLRDAQINRINALKEFVDKLSVDVNTQTISNERADCLKQVMAYLVYEIYLVRHGILSPESSLERLVTIAEQVRSFLPTTPIVEPQTVTDSTTVPEQPVITIGGYHEG